MRATPVRRSGRSTSRTRRGSGLSASYRRPRRPRRAGPQERRWARQHPREWAEWTRVSLLLAERPVFSSPFEFEHFLEDLGPAPSPQYAVARRDESLSYQQGNLAWVKDGRAAPFDGYSIDEVAAALRVSRKLVRAVIRDGLLPASNLGRPGRPTYRVTLADALAWLEKAKV